MKPCVLEFCGINSFSEPARIDFLRLSKFGLFGIFGDTGSGKSTILDCIGFALYGSVSRARSGSIAEIINFSCEKAYVNFEFEIVFEGRRRGFRVERELKRKNAVQSVRVYERETLLSTGAESGALKTVSDGVRDSNALLERIIGLEQKDFEKCIALPQGEFAQFVKAQKGDRLKLVSRLFNLEAYGEALVKRANANWARFCTERDLCLARLEPYAPYTVERTQQLKDEMKRLEERERSGKKALDEARETERRTAELLRRKEEYENASKRLAALEAQREEIEGIERELSRIERAQTALKFVREESVCLEAETAAKTSLERAQANAAAAQAREKELSGYDEEAADGEISSLTELRAAAEREGERQARREVLKKSLQSARLAYADEAERFQTFHYASKRVEIETALKRFDEEASLDEEREKAALLRAEYRRFAEELKKIYEKYPETEPDVKPLSEKYFKLSEGEKRDFSELRGAFEAREKARKEANERLIQLEKQNGLYAAHRERLQQLQTEGVRMKEELSALGEADKTLSKTEIEARLAAKRREKKLALEARENARRELASLSSLCAAAEEKLRSASERLLEARKRTEEALNEGGFASAGEAEELISRFGGSSARERAAAFREEYAVLVQKKRETAGDYSFVTSERLRETTERRIALETEREELTASLALKRDEFSRALEMLQKKAALEGELKEVGERAEIAERLKKLLEGNKFMEFAAEEYLQNIALSGSRRLLRLTDGRYFLRYDGGFLVGDNLAGGGLRSVMTLSGGETFLVSLSLALALSSELCQKSLRPIEFFFLDEGFGSLDSRLVDVVMDSLEKLKGEHFTIGVISHVEELKRRIESKISVKKATEQHGSQIEQS